MTDPDSSQSSSTAPDGADDVHRIARKRRWFWVAYAVVLSASVGFAIYQGMLFFGGQDVGEATKLASVRRSYERIGPPSLTPTTGPGGMRGDPLGSVGMTPLKGDPDDLVPPKGSKRRWGFMRKAGDEVEIMAGYVWRGDADAAAEYYKEYLGRKGMKFLGEQIRGPVSASTRPDSSRIVRSRRIFVFQGPKRHVTVTLRSSRKNDGTLSIILNLVYPES
jgi:hypothetical protein